MTYALLMLWYERQRFFAAILAVAFSTVLICIQFGLLMGMFALTSIPVDNAHADIWLGSNEVASVDVGRPIPDTYLNRLANQAEIEKTEKYLLGFQYWDRPDGGRELCIVIGCALSKDSIGAVRQLTPALRSQLTQPGTIVIDRSELDRLGVSGVGEEVTVHGKRVKIVGLVDGLPGLQGPYLFCSRATARNLLWMTNDEITYVLGKCRYPSQAEGVVARLKRRYPHMSVLTSGDLSMRSRMHWLIKTKGGIAVSIAAILGLLVGAVVTRQSIYSAAVAMMREYAVLRALGIPRWRMAVNLAWLSFWLGLVGVSVSFPITYVILQIAWYLHVPIQTPWWLVAAAVGVTWSVAVVAGLTTLRAVRQAEPVSLLR